MSDVPGPGEGVEVDQDEELREQGCFHVGITGTLSSGSEIVRSITIGSILTFQKVVLWSIPIGSILTLQEIVVSDVVRPIPKSDGSALNL